MRGRKHGRHPDRRRRHRRLDARVWRCTPPEFPAASSNPQPKSARSASASTSCRMPPRNSPRLALKPIWRGSRSRRRISTFFNRFGQLIYQEPLGRAAGYDHPQFSIHRGDLQMVLLEAFKSRAGRGSHSHQPPLHRRRAGRYRRHLAFFDGRRRTQHRARPRRDCLRRHQFGDPQAVLSRTRASRAIPASTCGAALRGGSRSCRAQA